MYHAHRYSRGAWAGEPEIDPALDYEEREEIEGWEMTPQECLDLAYGGVMRERFVEAGQYHSKLIVRSVSSDPSFHQAPVLLVSLTLTRRRACCVQQSTFSSCEVQGRH